MPPSNIYFFRFQGKGEIHEQALFSLLEGPLDSHPEWAQFTSDMNPDGRAVLCSHQGISAALIQTFKEPLHFQLPPEAVKLSLFPSLTLRLLLPLPAAGELTIGCSQVSLVWRGFKKTNLPCSSLNWGMSVHEQLQELSESGLWVV